jgi:hypothetical protein
MGPPVLGYRGGVAKIPNGRRPDCKAFVSDCRSLRREKERDWRALEGQRPFSAELA